ncbi:hypothetical protein DAKH74_020920 [Maudiozyma humilis]|uniref:Transposase n=1 Tax=Maudiozyma humilis TaxID=51915 RepID=A0AAV5RWD3_MAUHU|nr:hypothetical protein DAKH74_020920 [Kazachstania humilis]
MYSTDDEMPSSPVDMKIEESYDPNYDIYHPLEINEAMDQDKLWCEPHRKNMDKIWAYFLVSTTDSSYFKCKCCSQVFFFSRRIDWYKTRLLNEHFRSDCSNPPEDISAGLHNPALQRKVYLKKVDKNFRQFAINNKISNIDTVLAMTLKLDLPLSWVDAASRDLDDLISQEPNADSDSTKKEKVLNSKNLTREISTKVTDITEFWKREFASSQYVMDLKMTTTPANFKNKLLKRLNELNQVTFVSLVLDHWSDYKMDGYLGVVLTTFNRETDKLIPFLLKIPRSSFNASEDVLNDIAPILQSFPGLADVVLATATDNTSNIVECCKLLGDPRYLGKQYLGRLPCMPHSTNLMNGSIINSKDEGSATTTKATEQTESDVLTKNNELAYEINTSITKRKIFDEICLKRELVENGESLELKTFCMTRWVSALDSMQRLLLLEPVLQEMASSKRFNVNFTDDDFERAEEVVELLLPLRTLCEMLSNNTCTVKYSLPFLIQYKNTMEQENIKQMGKPKTGEKAIELLIDFTEKMQGYHEQYETDNIHIMSSYLNIDFVNRKFWTRFSKTNKKGVRAQEVTIEMAERYAELLIPLLNMSFEEWVVDTDSNSGALNNDLDADSSYLSEGLMEDEQLEEDDYCTPDRGDDSQFFDTNSIRGKLKELLIDELLTYRALAVAEKKQCARELLKNREYQQENMLLQNCLLSIGIDQIFWKKFGAQLPILSFVDSLFQNIPATSIDAEQMFSWASMQKTKERYNLSDKRFEDLCIIKSFGESVEFKHLNLAACSLKQALAITDEHRNKK